MQLRFTPAFLLAVSALLLSAPAHAAPLPPALHAYGLDASLADELGGAALTQFGGKVGGSRYRFMSNEGLGLTGAIPLAGYSIEMRFLPFETSGWRRLIDFKNRQSDTGLYIHDGRASLVAAANTDSAEVAFQSGQICDLLLTRDPETQQLRVYVDGALLLDLPDDAGTAVFYADGDGATQAFFFLDDLAVSGETTGGYLDHVRVFDHALSAADAVKLAKGKLPPNVTQK
jgi:hypothetical protein